MILTCTREMARRNSAKRASSYSPRRQKSLLFSFVRSVHPLISIVRFQDDDFSSARKLSAIISRFRFTIECHILPLNARRIMAPVHPLAELEIICRHPPRLSASFRPIASSRFCPTSASQ